MFAILRLIMTLSNIISYIVNSLTVREKLGSVKSPVTPGVTGDFTDPNFPRTEY